MFFFFFSSRRRHTRCSRDWSSDVCSSDLVDLVDLGQDRVVASRSDEIAGVHQTSIHPAVERGGDQGVVQVELGQVSLGLGGDRKSTRLNSSHGYISYAVFCLKKKKIERRVVGQAH